MLWPRWRILSRMPTPRTVRNRSVPVLPAEPAPNGSSAPVVARDASAERLTVPIKDGKIDWEKVRGSRREELRAMLTRSGIEAAPGAAREAAPPVLNAAIVGSLYDVLAQLESLVAVRMFGCTMDQAITAFTFSDAEKTALADPTARVLNKYLPASLLDKYADECMLLLLLGTMTRAKVSTLREVQASTLKPAPVSTENP